MESRNAPASPLSLSLSEAEKNQLKEDVINGGVSGFIAGGFARFTVGFKEGMFGGLLGGLLNPLLSFGYRKAGFSLSASEVMAFASTVLLDIGGLHHFGTQSSSAPVPYSSDEQMLLHHTVFYTALALAMTGLSLYKMNNENGLFSQQSSSRAARQEQAKEVQFHSNLGLK